MSVAEWIKNTFSFIKINMNYDSDIDVEILEKCILPEMKRFYIGNRKINSSFEELMRLDFTNEKNETLNIITLDLTFYD